MYPRRLLILHATILTSSALTGVLFGLWMQQHVFTRMQVILLGAGVAMVTMGMLRIGFRIWFRLPARRAAFYEDANELRRWITRVREYLTPAETLKNEPVLQLSEATALSYEGRWKEAGELLDTLAPKLEGTPARTIFLNNRAWIKAHAGEVDLAQTLILEALENHRTQGVPPLDLLLGTQGAIFSLAQQHTRAIETLRDAIARGGETYLVAYRYYFLGESLRALGQLEAAREAYETVVNLGTKGGLLKRARARLQATSVRS